VAAASFVLLFFGFLTNRWHVADQQWFLTHQHDTESVVLG
jgi:hypothetical protein